MIPIVAISGPSGSGKTTLIAALISEMRRRNHRVGTIKHRREPVKIDYEGKDSYRHKQAGAVSVAISTPNSTAVIRDEAQEPDIREIVERYLYDTEIVLAEGYKDARIPKIMMVDRANSESVELAKQDMAIAIVSKDAVDISGLTCFKPDDISPIVDFIEERYLNKEPSSKIRLMVDGNNIYMKPFVRDLVEEVIRGMIRTFKSTENAKKIVLFLDK